MKSIELHLEDDVYQELRQALGLRSICGNLFGPLDDFNRMLFAAIDKGQVRLVLERKKPEKRPKRKARKRT